MRNVVYLSVVDPGRVREQVRISSDLKTWARLLGTNVASGTLQWVDPSIDTQPARFYRLRFP
jgi:hypothetical protein